jgi:hypothetical protein
VFLKLYSCLPHLTNLQTAQLQLAGTTGAELSSATETALGTKFEYLHQAQIDYLWHHVRQLQLLEEHLNQLALLSILQDEQQLFSRSLTAGTATLQQPEGSSRPDTADSAAASVLEAEIQSLAQRLADQRLAYSFSLDMAAAAAAEAQSCRALQQQELQDANAERQLGGLGPLQPDALQVPAAVADAAELASVYAGSVVGLDAVAASCWKSLVHAEASTAGASDCSSSSSNISSNSLTVVSTAASSSGSSAAAITLTKAMLQQARGQLLVVQVAADSSTAGPVCSVQQACGRRHQRQGPCKRQAT